MSQLTLSLVALAVLAERPAESFFIDLALAWATADQSKQRHFFKNPPDSQIEEAHEFQCKDLDYNLGAILRWRYTETVKPKIESLRASHGADKLMLKGLDYMVKSFDQFGWTRGSIPEEQLRNRIPFFPSDRNNSHSRVMTCPELAMRDDLPDLCLNDQEVIAQKMERVFSLPSLRCGYSKTHEDSEMEYHLSWFAKYKPTNLIELGTRFRLACLNLAEIAPALHFANQLPFSASVVSPSDLLTKAKACALRDYSGPSNRFSWSLLQLHVLAFTCLPEIELKDWLVFASKVKSLRRELHFYPIPIICPLLLSRDLATFARVQVKLCSAEFVDESKVTESEFAFWAYIGGLGGEPDLEFNKWVSDQFKLSRPKGDNCYYWLLLWFRSAPQTVLEESVLDGSIVEYLAENGLWPMVSAQREITDWSKLGKDFAELAKWLPLDDLGNVLANAHRAADLDTWGQLIFSKALHLVGDPSFERKFWGTTVFKVGLSGEISGCTCEREDDSESTCSESLRPIPNSTLSSFLKPNAHEELERRGNEGIRIWREDMDQLATVERGAFNRFEGRKALVAWRDQQPELFCKYASELLIRVVSQPDKAFHIGGFIVCVIDVLVPLDPDLALQIDLSLRSSAMRVSVINYYGVSTFKAAYWRATAGRNARCQEICLKFICESSTDEELMYHAITAQAEGASEALLSICDSLLKKQFAKERSLAVSLLAWFPSESVLAKLENISTNDPSGWVRKHSKWAVECAKHEASIRRYYEQILKEKDRNQLQARLQVMLPAITPTARWWHCDMESKHTFVGNAHCEIQAALAFFWDNAKSECRRTPEVFGRKLNEYLRGERIHDLRNPKPRLNIP